MSGAGTASGRGPAEVSFQDTSYSRQSSGNPRSQKQPGVEERVVQLRLGLLAYLVGDQDLPADCLCHDAGRGMHRLSEQIAIPLGDLAGMDADADFDRALRVGGVVLVQRTLDRHGGTDRCHIGGEGDEKPVAQGFAYPATERCDLVLHDRCLQRENVVGVLVATCLPQLGRADDVGHHDRERVCCAAPIRQGLPPLLLLSCGSAVQNYGAEV